MVWEKILYACVARFNQNLKLLRQWSCCFWFPVEGPWKSYDLLFFWYYWQRGIINLSFRSQWCILLRFCLSPFMFLCSKKGLMKQSYIFGYLQVPQGCKPCILEATWPLQKGSHFTFHIFLIIPIHSNLIHSLPVPLSILCLYNGTKLSFLWAFTVPCLLFTFCTAHWVSCVNGLTPHFHRT